jgi:hypothetical protein
LGHSKLRGKIIAMHNYILKIREISNKYSNDLSQALRKTKTSQTQKEERKEIRKIWTEINEIEIKRTKISMKQKYS